jgi:hypothetical protein
MNSLPKSTRPYKVVPLSKSWSQAEIQSTLLQAKNKRSPDEIARKLNRPVSEVRSRLKVIAAEMYINDKIPYDKIHEVTGVEKSSFIITPSSSRNSVLDVSSDLEDIEQSSINSSIYEFDGSTSEVDTMIKVSIQDDPDVVTVTVSVESPFSVKSICEHISTPILSTFSTCSRFAKRLTNVQEETFFITNQSRH